MVSEEEIKNLLEYFHNEDGYGFNFWMWEGDQFTPISPSLEARRVSSLGGSEGGGEKVELVMEVRHTGLTIPEFNGSRFFKKRGAYYSHAGLYWDGYFDEVFPTIKTITVYERRA